MTRTPHENTPVLISWPNTKLDPEAWATYGWVLVTAVLIVATLFGALSPWIAGASALIVLAHITHLLLRFHKRWQLKKTLTVAEVALSRLHAFSQKYKGKIYFGLGHKWGPKHARLAWRISQCDAASHMTSGIDEGRDIGCMWLRQIGEKKAITKPVNFQDGHLGVIGTTGAGKSQFLKLLINQMVARHEAVVLIDPKNDQDLRQIAYEAMRMAGRADRYWQLMLSDTAHSVRCNPLQNYQDAKELASRIASWLPASSEGVFTSFSEMVLQRICQNLDLCQIRPTLRNINDYLSHPAELLKLSFAAHLGPRMPHWEQACKPFIRALTKDSDDVEKAAAYDRFYQQVVKQQFPDARISELLRQAVHNRDHLQRMITSLSPVMATMTTGHIGALLSPDPRDEKDTRRIASLQRIVEQGGLFYVGTSGLANQRAGAYLGSAIASDLAALAASRNEREGMSRTPVNLVVDEAVELMVPPFIALLNKGRGAGFRVTIATQTISDIAAVLGSRDKAWQALGNINNLVMVRVRDHESYNFFANMCQKVLTRSVSVSRSESQGPNGPSASKSFSTSTQEIELVPRDVMMSLPDLEFFTVLKSGEVFHGQIPILKYRKSRKHKR